MNQARKITFGLALAIQLSAISNSTAQKFLGVTVKTEWAEPVFDDHVSDIGATSGSFEFNYVPFFQILDGQKNNGQGMEITAVLSDRLAVESGFCSVTARDVEGVVQSRSTQMEFSAAYLFFEKTSSALLAGIEFETPYYLSGRQSPDAAWEFVPFATFSRRLSKGFSFQLKPRLGLEIGHKNFELGAALGGAIFWQKGDFLASCELGTAFDGEPTVSVAPGFTYEIGNFGLCLGYEHPLLDDFAKEGSGIALARLIYVWENSVR